jgi:hypothetical protein
MEKTREPSEAFTSLSRRKSSKKSNRKRSWTVGVVPENSTTSETAPTPTSDTTNKTTYETGETYKTACETEKKLDVKSIESAIETVIRQAKTTPVPASTPAIKTTPTPSHKTTYRTRDFNLYVLTSTEQKILDFLIVSCFRTGSRSTDLIKARIMSERVAVSVTAIRKCIQRMRNKGWILPLEKGDVVTGDHGGTRYRLEESVWKEMSLNNKTYETDMRHHETTPTPTSKSTYETELLVSKLIENKKIINQTNRTTIYDDYLGKDLLEELKDVGVFWSDVDTRWLEGLEVEPKAFVISLRHYIYDCKKGHLPPNIKSRIAWLKGSILKNGVYCSNAYLELANNRKTVEQNFIKEFKDDDYNEIEF